MMLHGGGEWEMRDGSPTYVGRIRYFETKEGKAEERERMCGEIAGMDAEDFDSPVATPIAQARGGGTPLNGIGSVATYRAPLAPIHTLTLAQRFERMAVRWLGDSEDQRLWDQNHRMEVEVSREMCISRLDVERTVVEEVEQVAAVDPLVAAARAAGITPDCPTHTVSEHPRFVAQVVVALRMRLGQGSFARTPDNEVLVRREAARLLRNENVRTIDAAAMLERIELAYFGDRTHGRAGRWREVARSKSFVMRFVLGKDNPYSA